MHELDNTYCNIEGNDCQVQSALIPRLTEDAATEAYRNSQCGRQLSCNEGFQRVAQRAAERRQSLKQAFPHVNFEKGWCPVVALMLDDIDQTIVSDQTVRLDEQSVREQTNA